MDFPTDRHIADVLKERNIELATNDPIVRGGFTQVPNFILRNGSLSLGAKVTYAMFLHYGWHNNFCFPGQERLAEDMGMSQSRVSEFIKELSVAQLIEIKRRGMGKTNIYKIKFVVQKPGKNAKRQIS
ncbi:MAG TPA: helix-turn-helix domain-containing protein [Xanthobacteraceae bacterium]|nr:helix-turn-helix domain-containing protein [Xanthobacteraceae bacterium]